MGFFNKLIGGDAGIEEAMYETYEKLKVIHPYLEEYEILALVLHRRFKRLSPDIGLVIAVLFPRIDILTEWVVGLENSGGPRRLNEYFAYTTTSEDREKALNYLQQKASNKAFPKKSEPILKKFKVLEDIVDISSDFLWDKFYDELNYSSEPLDYLSDELMNTVANIYYRYFMFCKENPSECEKEEYFEKIKNDMKSEIDFWGIPLKDIIKLSLEAFPNKFVAEYFAINNALEWLAEVHDSSAFIGGLRYTDDLLIAIFKYKIDINEAYSRTVASLVAECKMRESESDEIPNLMYYFDYSWGRHFNNPYQS